MNKKRLLAIAIILIFAFDTPIGMSVQNPSLRNPADVTTIPPSYTGNGLVDTSGYTYANGNEIVTGNVRRGMYFRGNVPYSSPSSFSSTLGSASLSSFMRDSAGAEDIGSNRGSTVGSATGANYQTYYLPSATVTRMSPNRAGLATTANTRIDNNTQYVSGSQTQQNQPASVPDSSAATSTGYSSAQNRTLWQLYNPGLAGAQNQANTPGETGTISSSPRPNRQNSQDSTARYQQDETSAFQQYLQQSQTNQNTMWSRPDNLRPFENLPAAQSALERTTVESQNSRQMSNQINSRGQWQGQHQQQNPQAPRYGLSETVPAMTAGESVPATTQRLTPVTSNVTQLTEQSSAGINPQQSLAANNNAAYQQYPALQTTGTQQYQRQPGKFSSAAQNFETSEALAQIQKQLDELIRSIDNRLQNPTDRTSQYTTSVQDISSPRQAQTPYQYEQTNRDLSGQANNSRLQELMNLPDSPETQLSQNQISPLSELKQLSQAEISARAKRIMGQYTDYESFSQAKYIQLYRAAEGHLNIGRFQQAADAFTLAAIYNPNDPLCYAGRGHALFAAGEYISSALFLIRAIELEPEYVNTQVDLVELLGGAEQLNNKIAELNTWLQKSNAPGLGFLLGYVYYHTGRLNDAGQVIDIVLQEMPRSTAALALKMAIDLKLKNRQ